MAFCTIEDLEKVRPNIRSLGIPDDKLEQFISESDDIITRVLTSRWYRPVAERYGVDPRETLFDVDLLLESEAELTRLGCYKTLELMYLHAANDTPEEDGFSRASKTFEKKFKDELDAVLEAGLSYDWDESGSIALAEERQIEEEDRLYRQ
jgi:hypothetical protein